MTPTRPHSTREEQLQFIRQKCIEANSELIPDCAANTFGDKLSRPIRLADTLLALQPIKHWRITRAAQLSVPYGRLRGGQYVDWNLRQDDINDQSDPCVAFIYELLQ